MSKKVVLFLSLLLFALASSAALADDISTTATATQLVKIEKVVDVGTLTIDCSQPITDALLAFDSVNRLLERKLGGCVPETVEVVLVEFTEPNYNLLARRRGEMGLALAEAGLRSATLAELVVWSSRKTHADMEVLRFAPYDTSADDVSAMIIADGLPLERGGVVEAPYVTWFFPARTRYATAFDDAPVTVPPGDLRWEKNLWLTWGGHGGAVHGYYLAVRK